MTAGVHRFSIGTFECMTILDGIAKYPPGMFFVNLAAQQYVPALSQRGYSSEEMDMPITCLVVRTPRELILIDTGAKGIVPGAGQLPRHLRAEGLEPADIDAVVLTHGHGDHIAGNLLDDGTPAFPNARYVMLDAEWNFWMTKPNLTELPFDEAMKQRAVAFTEQKLSGITSRLELAKPDTEIAPGIIARPAFGHTPGQLALEISSSGERLVFMADAVIDPIDVEYPEARAIVDHLPDEMVRTRKRLLEDAASDRCLVGASHFPFPGLGRVDATEHGWRWQPVTGVK